MEENADFVIIGAGILGLTVALRLREAHPTAVICVIEKEHAIGRHASGRNSGVLHSGIYYPPQSLKAKLCIEGAALLRAYCQEHRLPFNPIGKVIVPIEEHDAATLTLLHQRALANKIQVELIDEQQLYELEPATRSATGQALFVPHTAVVDSHAIMRHLYDHLCASGVKFSFGHACHAIESRHKYIKVGSHQLAYGHLINTAGLYADKIAMMAGLADRYTMIPFKGLYYEVQPQANLQLKRLIYPVPDMNVPFLGVHFTQSIQQKIYVGPTAVPALGRENYRGWHGLRWSEAIQVFYQLGRQYQLNQQGFRQYAHNEIGRFVKAKFVEAAQKLVPEIRSEHLKLSTKVGIRAQLLDLQNKTLVMDFLTKQTANETHILNAVSPAFTSSLSFSHYVVEQIK